MVRPPVHAAPRRRRWGWWLVAGFLFVLFAWAGLLGWDAWQARAEAETLQASAARAQEAVSARDVVTLRAEVETLSVAANGFADHTQGPQWWLAAQIPWVQDQVRPLQAAGVAVRALADEALTPLSQLEDLDALANPEFTDGRIDPFLMEPYRPTLEQVQSVLRDQIDALDAVDTSGSVAVVGEAFGDLTGQLDDLVALVDDATTLSQLLPGMLGGEGPRTYAVMLQNNAEPRASGGIPGAVIMVTIDDGRPLMGEYYSAGELNIPREPIEGATQEEIDAFGEAIALYAQDVNFTPQFPRAAQLMSEFVERETGQAPDGVVSLDPVALGYMLGDAPAQEVAGIEVSGANLAEVMLNRAYFEFEDPSEQDAFFAATAGALFSEVLAGGSSAVDGLARALDESRFSVWSSVPEEQSLLQPTPAGGDQLRDGVWSGVFVNDGSGSKIGYYVDVTAGAEVSMCVSDGRVAEGTLTVNATHSFDGEVAELPDYIAGVGNWVPEGDFGANFSLIVPDGYRVLSVMADGDVVGYSPAVVAGRDLVIVPVALSPGEAIEITMTVMPESPFFTLGDVFVTPGSKPVLNFVGVDSRSTDC
ncbi:DUF4012 domain-containing protein [Demequina zhanjiangensis]|uniref:DUF4012 domain-containing protein n=1 Tax=Demequina zhanjiangensis TaxID=3051659 RepID=A0ABT8FYY9_9MICO|nr:DUF4012 domain-containing protein [Demequina sp. SYSU T00b26]MDN4472032.1 DUF4012 domain-containing protein [Demequina sp. SYSU T00b26]